MDSLVLPKSPHKCVCVFFFFLPPVGFALRFVSPLSPPPPPPCKTSCSFRPFNIPLKYLMSCGKKEEKHPFRPARHVSRQHIRNVPQDLCLHSQPARNLRSTSGLFSRLLHCLSLLPGEETVNQQYFMMNILSFLPRRSLMCICRFFFIYFFVPESEQFSLWNFCRKASCPTLNSCLPLLAVRVMTQTLQTCLTCRQTHLGHTCSTATSVTRKSPEWPHQVHVQVSVATRAPSDDHASLKFPVTCQSETALSIAQVLG